MYNYVEKPLTKDKITAAVHILEGWFPEVTPRLKKKWQDAARSMIKPQGRTH